MSTEQSLDPNLIEQTKQQIRALVAEIAQLAKEDITPEEFYSGFLNRVVSALAAVGGAVWTTNDEGHLALQYQINLQETRLRESEQAQQQHSRLLYKVLSDGEAVILPPHSGGGEDEAGNPTDFLILLGLMKTDLETGGIVEIFQRTDSGAATQKGYLRFLIQMCELAADYLKSHQLRHFSDRQSLWTQLEDFTRVIHASLDPRETAFTIANEGRRLIECDRISVAIRKGGKCYVESISGQDVFDKRSNLVRLMNRLASAVVATGDAIWYTGDTRDMAPQVEDAVQEYVDEAHSKTVAVLPLKRPEPPEEDDPKKKPEPQPCIGAIIVEQIEDSRVPPSMLSRVEVVCRHSAAALANSLEHQNLFLMPLWRAIGKSRWIVSARTLPKTISISLAIVAVILFLCFFPADFTLETKGTLEPVERQNIYANVDKCTVQDIYVKHGATVKVDQPLLKLSSPDIALMMEDTVGKLGAAEKKLWSLESEINRGSNLPDEERNRKISETLELKATIVSLKAQRELLKEKQSLLLVKSPLEGIVTTWDLQRRLGSRPLQYGTTLMQIADLNKPWQLELHMPEQNMGFVVKAQRELYAAERKELRKILLDEKRAATAGNPTEDPAPANETPAAEQAATPPEGEPAAPADSTNPAPSVPAASTAENPLAAEVDAELEKIPDRELHDRWGQIANAKLAAQLQDIFKNGTDVEAKGRLDEILAQPTYESAWEKLCNWKNGLEDGDALKTSLANIKRESFIDDNVTFILYTESDRSLKGRIVEIGEIADIRGEEGNTVLIKVAIDKSELRDLRPGAQVSAKVACGRSSLGYRWLHQVIAWVQKTTFKYF